MELNKEQIEFLNDSTKDPWTGVSIGVWTINEKTGLVDIKGNFDCGRRGKSSFKGIKFGVVTGNFDCRSCWFYGTLEGAPQEVGGNFDCSNSVIKSLEGAPRRVGGNFDCSGNNFKNLKGAPKEVGGNFICTMGYSRGKLTSLKGAPKEVGGDFNCSYNSLKSLVGAPQKVGGDFNCSNNNLTSLEGAPQKVGSGLLCSDNELGIPNYILNLMYKTMKGCGVNYYVALHIHREAIEEEIDKILKPAEKKAGEMKNVLDQLDAHMTKEEQKAISVASRYGHFN